ncbi:MAG TPA: plastocyanin/azurin family copper-binding protein [Nitrososphaera sp.]
MGKPGVIAFPVLLVLGAITGYLTYDMLVIQSTPVEGNYDGSPYRKDLAGAQTPNAAPAENATTEEQPAEETPATEEPPETEGTPSATTINAEITPGALNKSTDAYAPNPIEANVGDTVVWTNKDSTIHTVTSGTPSDGADGQFGGTAEGPELVFANAQFQHTFDAAGEYDYYCTLHPAMVGKVIVSE